MKILYFGAYNKDYSRNRVLMKGLRENGAEVAECNVRPGGLSQLIKLLFKYIKTKKDFDLMVVGFPGQESMLLARILTRKPIIFDTFTSHYGGHVIDRGTHKPKSFAGRYYRWIDRHSVLSADLALLDTEAHIDFFVREFGLPKDKFTRVFVGSDSGIFRPMPDPEGPFHVHFHGNFIPLQGTSTIMEAARILEPEGITFQIIGRGQTHERDVSFVERHGMKNIEFFDSVPYGQLPAMMARAHVCLGIFGNSPKTDLVIPNKIFEAIACAKPVITAETPAVKELFIDKKTILMCRKADSVDLADKIRLLRDDKTFRESLASSGHAIFEEKLKEKDLAGELLKNIYERRLLQR